MRRFVTAHQENIRVFSALCDVTRLKVLELLRSGEKCAAALQEKLGIGQSNLSHHMKILTESGIVTARKERKWTIYSLCERGARYAAALLRLLTAKNKAAETKSLPANTEQERNASPMKPFTIVVDTDCDLPPAYIQEHGIEVLPIPFLLNGTEHNQGSWQEICDKDFYDALRNGGTAMTSQINMDTFTQVFTEYAQQGKDALVIVLSGNLSSTYQSALLALNEVKEVYPDCNIHPIDSVSATSLNGLMAMLAVQKRAEGLTAAETAAWLAEKKQSLLGFFTVDDLMYLHRGGRLSKLSAIGGSVLGIKPLLNMQPDGSLALKDKVRGRNAALKLMVSQLQRSVNPDTVLDTVFITHTDCEADANRLAEMVKAAVPVRELIVMVMGPVIGAHVGPGALTLAFEGSMTREAYEQRFYNKKQSAN